jgi:hypothetical protein
LNGKDFLLLNSKTLQRRESWRRPAMTSCDSIAPLERRPDLAREVNSSRSADLDVVLLTGCKDRPYAFGLAMALISKGVRVAMIGSDGSRDGTRFVPGAKVYYRQAGRGSLSYLGFSNRKLEAQWISMKLHIKCLLSLQDDQRAKRPVSPPSKTGWLFSIPNELRSSQGASTRKESWKKAKRPFPSWKYPWIDAPFGMPLARRAQVLLPRIKCSLIRSWDKTLLKVQGSKFPEA